MIRAILTDIEGTTSSLSFVKDVLFPYARERMAGFIASHADKPEVACELAEVRRLQGVSLSDAEITEQLIQWIDADQKVTPLKALQGMIWESGYENGDFFSHIYEDAVRNLREWNGQGLRLYVFSSGSVHAQKLLFAHTTDGDLTPLFSGYFDTQTGPKQVATSYEAIARAIGVPPQEILFLSDIVGELDAAHAAGLRTVWLVRGCDGSENSAHVVARSFDEIVL